jgi:hypothetical protein
VTHSFTNWTRATDHTSGLPMKLWQTLQSYAGDQTGAVFGGRDPLPSVLTGCVVQVRVGPGNVIPKVKLPWPIEGNCAQTQSIRDKDRLGRRGFRLGARNGGTRNQQRRDAAESEDQTITLEHAASILWHTRIEIAENSRPGASSCCDS